MNQPTPSSERFRKPEQPLQTGPTLQEYIEQSAGMRWDVFKAKMEERGINPGYFAMSKLAQLDKAFIDEMNIAIGLRKDPQRSQYRSALETAQNADDKRGKEIDGNASSRIDQATASLRRTAAELVANREKREKDQKRQ